MADFCKLSNSDCKCNFSFVLNVEAEPLLLQEALGCAFLLLLQYAVLIQVSLHGLLTCLWQTRNSAGQSHLAGNCAVVRNNFSREVLLFICGLWVQTCS